MILFRLMMPCQDLMSLRIRSPFPRVLGSCCGGCGSCAANWAAAHAETMCVCEIEEVEEILVQESLTTTSTPVMATRSVVPPAPTLPLPGNLTLDQWGTNVVNFGRKHKGKTFAAVMHQDAGYLQWSLARYGSLTPEHQDFVRYGQLWMKEVGNDL